MVRKGLIILLIFFIALSASSVSAAEFSKDMVVSGGQAKAILVTGTRTSYDFDATGLVADRSGASDVNKKVVQIVGSRLLNKQEVVLSSSHKSGFNLILVGGPVANSLTNELVENGKSKVDWYTSEGDIEVISDAFSPGKFAIIVAGKDRMATTRALNDLVSLINPTATTIPSPTFPPYNPDTPTMTPAPKVSDRPKVYDSDGDTIADSLDECPEVYGKLEYLGCPSDDPDSADRTGGVIAREYRWKFKGSEYVLNSKLSSELYNYYRDKPRVYGKNLGVYATDSLDDTKISSIVNELTSDAEEWGLTKFETINFVVGFVQSLPYTKDDVTTAFDEYPRYPYETLVDNGGDCEDTAILTATLLKEMGYGVVLLDFPGHVAVGVKCDRSLGYYYTSSSGIDYCYLETTGIGWGIGEIPDDYIDLKAEFRYLVAKPVIDIDWDTEILSSTSSSVTYGVHIVVKNIGSATAENLKIWTTFEAPEEGMMWKQHIGDSFELNPGGTVTSDVTMPISRGLSTRLRISVVGDNFYTEKAYSKWLST